MKEEYEKTIQKLQDKYNRSEHDFDDLQESYDQTKKSIAKFVYMVEKLGEFYDSLGAKIQKLEEVNGIPKKPKRI